MKTIILILFILAGCGDYAAPVPTDVLEDIPTDVVECLTHDDCTDSGRLEGYCESCLCVREERSPAPCWKLGDDE